MKRLFAGSLTLFLAVLLFPLSSRALCVDASAANLRKGPGKGYETVWKVYRYMPLQRVGTSLTGSWYAVKDVDGEIEWIHKSLVSSRNRCAVVKTDTARIRTGPGLSHPVRFKEPAVQYEAFKVLGVKRDWVKVLDEGQNVGWINRKLLWLN